MGKAFAFGCGWMGRRVDLALRAIGNRGGQGMMDQVLETIGVVMMVWGMAAVVWVVIAEQAAN
jgi:hypothetical protein